MERNNLRSTLLAISLLMGFVFLVSFIAYYVKERHSVYQTCSCLISLPWIIILLSSLGVFVVTLTSYFLNSRIIREKRSVKNGVLRLMNYLDKDEKMIVTEIARNSGKMAQSKIVEKTGIDKVKVFRILERLGKREIIRKEKNGMTNRIILDQEILNLLND
jgi:uncharacterized membrane protein